MTAYVRLLCAEIDACRATAERLGADVPAAVDTLYFGGGTPSLLMPEQWRQIFAALRRNFDLSVNAEVTMEAAPGQIGEDVLEEAMRLGVGRVSLGVQSFVDRESAAVGRTHTGDSCLREIARLRAAGIKEVAMDLIAGLPYQTEESWGYSLQHAVTCGATHLSVYMLEVDEDSRLGREVMAGGVRFHAHGVPSDDASAALYEQACAWLESHEFPLYEISNFAGGEHQSRHNRKYWERKPYMGFGLDAHSMLWRRDAACDEQTMSRAAVRFANCEELSAYTSQTWVSHRVDVGDDEAFDESIFLGLRLREGVCVQSLRQTFGEQRVRACEQEVQELVDGGLMRQDDGRWTLTSRGRMVSSEIFGRLLAGREEAWV